jgi:glycosyltransferase involved in cell wall biosynthesis
VTGVTALVLTFNEAANIDRTLSRLSWAERIVIVDSQSTDETCAIAGRHPNVTVFQRPFTTHAEQWNFGLEQTGITSEWVLAIDADFLLSEGLVREVAALEPAEGVGGYQASFRYCIDGRPLRSGVYPPVTVLFRRARARYEQDGHTQRVRVTGTVAPLAEKIWHDDRKPLAHWLSAQSRYMRLEADKLSQTPVAALGLADRARRLVVIAPPAMFFYCLVVRGGWLDGRAGLFYALQRATSELILSLFLLQRKLERTPANGRP